MAPMRNICLLAVLAVIAFVALSAPAASATNAPASWKAAPSCCKGCSYVSGCCCSPAVKKPVTVTKFQTKTKTISKAKRVLYERYVEPEVAVTADADDHEESVEVSAAPEIGLFKRHLCPVCPLGAVLGKNNGGGVKYCCPRRTTKTVTKVRTKTMTVKVMYITSRLYKDMNGDGVYSNPPDVPYAKQKVIIALPAKKKVARADGDLGVGYTDANGAFSIAIPTQPAGTDLQVQDASGNVVAEVTIDQSGGVPPIEAPVVPAGVSTKTKTATANGGQQTTAPPQPGQTTVAPPPPPPAQTTAAPPPPPPGGQTTAAPPPPAPATTAAPGGQTTAAPAQTTAAAQQSTTVAAAVTTTKAVTTTVVPTVGKHMPISWVGAGYPMGATAVASDNNNNVYVYGVATIDPPGTAVNFSLTVLGAQDCVLYKISSATQDVAWITQWGKASGSVGCGDVAVAADGSKVFVSGRTGDGLTKPTSATPPSAQPFISAIDGSDGSHLWTNFYGAEQVSALAVDSSSNVYAAGYYTSSSWSFASAAVAAPNAVGTGTSAKYIFKVTSTGTETWIKPFPANDTGYSAVYDLCISDSGSLAYVLSNDVTASYNFAVVTVHDLANSGSITARIESSTAMTLDVNPAKMACKGEKAYALMATGVPALNFGGVIGSSPTPGSSYRNGYVAVVNATGAESILGAVAKSTQDTDWNMNGITVAQDGTVIVAGWSDRNPCSLTVGTASTSTVFLVKYMANGTSCDTNYSYEAGSGSIVDVATMQNGNVVVGAKIPQKFTLGTASAGVTGLGSAFLAFEIKSDLTPIV